MRRAAALAGLVMLVSACTSSGSGGASGGPTASAPASSRGGSIAGPVVRIASFDFPESTLLAQIYGQALRDRGYPVAFDLGLGPREIVEPALQQGFVDFVPEYLGSALEFAYLGAPTSALSAAQAHDTLSALMAPRGVVVLAPAPAEDQNAIVVTAATAQAHGLRTIKDLAPFAAQMAFGGPPECTQRPYCLPGLQKVYGLRFKAFVQLDAGGPYTVQALERGDVQVALLFSSDGEIKARGFTVLRDDRNLQQEENVTPVVRGLILRAYGPAITSVVNSVSGAIETVDLVSMNLEVEEQGKLPADVARNWLEEHGFGR